MCWFSDCRELRTKYKELRDVNYDLESHKTMLRKANERTDEWRNQWMQSRKEMADLIKPQWIDREHVLPRDGQRVNVLAFVGQWGVKERTIADYCACKGFTHPFETLYPDYKTMQVMYWSPIPEMTDEMKGMR